MNDKQLQDWLTNKQAKQTEAEATGLSAAEQKELARFDRLWEAASPPPLEGLEVDTAAAWAKVEDRLFGAEEQPIQAKKSGSAPKIIRLFNPYWWKVAAAISLLLVAGWWWQNQQEPASLALLVYSTNEEQKQEVLLPDGSKAWLNASSSLTYDPNQAEQRLLSLSGEAFFEVSRDEDRPFIVRTGELETRVLGTSFNIRAYANEAIEVAVSSGQVAVEKSNKEQRVLLAANEIATYEPEAQSLHTTKEKLAQANAWLSGQLVFEEQALGDMLTDLERFYDLKFEVSNPQLLDCTLTARFLQTDMEAALDLLEFQFGPLKTQGNTVRLEAQSCH